MKYEPHWGSHIPLLLRALCATRGPVLEMGMGTFSTPILHWLCFDADRQLVSLDDDPKWVNAHASFVRDWHRIEHVEDWDAYPLTERYWSVALIDHAPPERRKVDALRLADHAEIILLHDTHWQQEKHHHYRELDGQFRYRQLYAKAGAHAHTTAVSRTHDFAADGSPRLWWVR